MFEPNTDRVLAHSLAAHQAPADRDMDVFETWEASLPERFRDLLKVIEKHSDLDLWATFWAAREAGGL